MRPESRKVEFFRKVSLLIDSGVPLISILNGLSREGNPYAAEIADALRDSWSVGEAFSLCFDLTHYEEILLNVGQKTGNISLAFRQIADRQENSRKFRNEATSTMLRPMLTIFVSIVVMLFILFKVAPTIESMAGAKSSFITLASVMRASIPVVGFLLALAAASCYVLHMTNKVLLWKLFCSIPFAGRMVLYSSLYNFFSIVSLMHRGGVGVINAMEEASEESNPYVRQCFTDALDAVNEGAGLRQAIENAFAGRLPFYVLDMLDNIRQTGKYDEFLEKIASLIKTDFLTMRDRALPVVEGASNVLIALVLVSSALSFLGPMHDMLTHLVGGGYNK